MAYALFGNEIIWELLHDEIIIANLEVGVYYSIRGSGIGIWQLLMAGRGLSSIEALVRERYGAANGVASFIERLLMERLLVSKDVLQGVVGEVVWPEVYEEPQFERYEEMKNLLMLDPIHEVDEMGWPSRK